MRWTLSQKKNKSKEMMNQVKRARTSVTMQVLDLKERIRKMNAKEMEMGYGNRREEDKKEKKRKQKQRWQLM